MFSNQEYETLKDYMEAVKKEEEYSRRLGKPEVEIENALIGSRWGGERILQGYPKNHPRKDLNGQWMYSSYIVKQDGDTIETRNTIYKVKRWSPLAPEGSEARLWKLPEKETLE